MITNHPAHGFWDWLRVKTTHPARKPEVKIKTGKCSPKPAKRAPDRTIAFLEMP